MVAVETQTCEPGDTLCDPSVHPFVPTDEWQEVLPGQVVPDSCDVKLVFESGKQFARNRPEPAGIQAEEGPPEDPAAAAEREAAATAKMYEILLGLPEPPAELLAPETSKLSPEELTELLTKLWNRRQEFLKETYDDSADTEQEILQGNLNLLSMLTSPADDAELSPVLEELEYLAAQTDNARTIQNLKGWPAIAKTLEAPTDHVVMQTAWLVGTAVKLDEQVQNAALDANVMAHLLARLPGGTLTEQQQPSSTETLTKVSFALGHLLRGNRRSQRIFSESGGSAILRDGVLRGAVAARALDESASGRKAVSLLSKVLALVTDLLQEPNALPSLVTELSTAEWCGAVAGAAQRLPAGASGAAQQAQELSLHTMLGLLTQAADPQACSAAIFADGGAEAWRGWLASWEALANQPGEEGEYPEQLAEIAERLLSQAPR